MASTLTAATMTVTLTESILLNGKNQGSSNTKTFSSIVEVTKRILTVTVTEAVIATFSAAISAGNYIAADVMYIMMKSLSNLMLVNPLYLMVIMLMV